MDSMDSWAQPMVNWLHEMKSCYTLNLSDISMIPAYAWYPPPSPARWDEWNFYPRRVFLWIALVKGEAYFVILILFFSLRDRDYLSFDSVFPSQEKSNCILYYLLMSRYMCHKTSQNFYCFLGSFFCQKYFR